MLSIFSDEKQKVKWLGQVSGLEVQYSLHSNNDTQRLHSTFSGITIVANLSL